MSKEGQKEKKKMLPNNFTHATFQFGFITLPPVSTFYFYWSLLYNIPNIYTYDIVTYLKYLNVKVSSSSFL